MFETYELTGILQILNFFITKVAENEGVLEQLHDVI